MSIFNIDSDVPMPPIRRFGNKYPLGDMKVGDSFLVTFGSLQNGKTLALRAYVSRWGKKNGMEFSVRKVSDGYRVWRVK